MLRDSMLNFFSAIWFTVSVVLSIAALAGLVITALALVSAARDFHRHGMTRVRRLSAETSDRTR